VAAQRSGEPVSTWSARPVVVWILAGVTTIGVALGLVGWLVLGAGDGGGDDATDRNQVTARATDFAVAYNTYDVADLPDYQKRLKGLLTPAYDKQFVEITDAVFGALKSKQQKSGDADVLAVAIDSIDDDSATAIVAVDASITNTDNQAAVQRQFRWKVSFTKAKDEWLVSNFESVASVDAQTGPAPSDAAPSDAAPTSPADPSAPAGGEGQ
jgi:Mce-associated membrane protein